jgi:hypothetical protein
MRPESADRREFLRACGRAGVGAALVSAGAVLGVRSVASGACVNAGLCGGCSRVGGCGLPDALQYRRRAGAPGRGGHV